VAAVQVWRQADRDENCEPLCRAGIGHGQQVRPIERQLGVELVLELIAGPDAATTSGSPPWIMKPGITRVKDRPA